MRRLLFALLLAASCLQAASFTFTSCSAGTITLSPCNSDAALDSGGLVSPESNFMGPTYIVRTFAAVPSPFAAGAMLSADAAGYSQLNAPVGSIALSGIAEAIDSLTYQGKGPVRSGFIQFDVGLDYAHEDFDGAAVVTLTDGVHSYSFDGGGGVHGPITPVECGIESCSYAGMLPFLLGSPFDVSAFATAYPNRQDGGSESLVNFTLLEADGITPAAFYETPEPLTRGLQIAGLILIAFWLRKRAGAF